MRIMYKKGGILFAIDQAQVVGPLRVESHDETTGIIYFEGDELYMRAENHVFFSRRSALEELIDLLGDRVLDAEHELRKMDGVGGPVELE